MKGNTWFDGKSANTRNRKGKHSVDSSNTYAIQARQQPASSTVLIQFTYIITVNLRNLHANVITVAVNTRNKPQTV